MLSAHNISVLRGSKALLDNVSLDCEPGEVTVILGPNGAGKSTLLRVISGAMAPEKGRVTLDGEALTTYSRPDLAKRRAVLAQESMLQFDFTVEEVVILGRIPHLTGWESRQDREICAKALEMVEMTPFRRRSYPTLSGGEKQRVHLARVLAQLYGHDDASSRWMLLDEPTSALDLRHQHATLSRVRELAQELGFGVCAVLHDLNLAMRYADKVLLLQNGRTAACGAVRETLTEELISRVYGVRTFIHCPAAGCCPFIQTETLTHSFAND